MRVLLLTHAGLGEVLVEIVEHIYGDRPPGLLTLAPHGDDLAPLRAQLQELIDSANCETPLLILCDIRGASPANALPTEWGNPWVRAIYGLSLPMLLRALSRRAHWDALAEEVARGAAAAVQCHPESTAKRISALD
ncbi:PTS sugar transporter subunit IIA [Acidithiobacillus sp. IBUN Pt1247-S3]|uniref:PTS sugar transporter subunit IIA n=1 Tax=Acidithiobacillus sp. IBUN Pt1247-S3 TaxID=3166642 RepID=UPI0034E5E179